MASKGITSMEQLLWVLRLLFLIIVIISTLGIIRAYMNVKADVSDLEIGMMARRIVSAPGFAFVDRAGLIHNYIPKKNLVGRSEDILLREISFPKPKFAARIDVEDRSGKPVGSTVYFNENKFNLWAPQSTALWTDVKMQQVRMPTKDGMILVSVVKG